MLASLSWTSWLLWAVTVGVVAPADAAPAEDGPATDASAADDAAPEDATGDAPAEDAAPDDAAEDAAPEDGGAEAATADEPAAEDGAQEPATEEPSDSVAEQDVPSEPEATEPETTEPTEADMTDPSEISSVMDALEPTPLPPLVPKHRFVYKNLFALRYNPLGLVNDNAMGWQMRLYDKRGALFEPAYMGAKLHTFVSPAYSRVGPQLEFSPLAILNLSATYDFVGYYGTFNQMASYATPAADYSDTALEANDEAGNTYGTFGSLVTLSGLLQAKAGPIAVRDNFKAYYTDFKLRNGGNVYYDQTLDILVPDKGWSMTNDLDLLYLFDFGLKLGARYTVTHAVYKARHFQANEPITKPNGPTHRIGPALLYTFYNKPQKRFNKPTIILLSQWWVRHRYRTGADVSGAVPYVVLGFLFEGDLFPNPKKTYAKKK